MLFSLCYVHRKEGNMRLYLSNAELIEFYPSKYLDEFCKQTKVKLIDVYDVTIWIAIKLSDMIS